MLKKNFTLFCLCFIFAISVSLAQNNEASSDTTIFKLVDIPPSFPGGVTKLLKFLYSNIYYPKEAKSLGIDGQVIVQFVIDTDGSLTNVELLRDIGGGCGKEAIRVIKMMPNWNPGIFNNQPVKTQYILPVKFKLEGVRKNLPIQAAQFVGGEAAMNKYIMENIIYPERAKKKNIEGIVELLLKFDEKGNIESVKVWKDIGGGCGKAAKLLVKNMPKWEPATQAQKPVPVEQYLNIEFDLE